MTGGQNKRERRTRESLFVTLDADDDEADMIDGVAGGLKNEEYDGGKNRFFAFTPLPDTLGVTTYDFVTFGAAAAHCMKFKKGGLYSLKNKLLKLRGTDGSSYVSKYSGRAHEDSKLLPEPATVGNGVAVDISLIQWFYSVDGTESTDPTIPILCLNGMLQDNYPRISTLGRGWMLYLESERNEFLNEDYIMLTDHFEPGQEFVVLKQGDDENGKLASGTLRNISTTEGLGQSQESFADVGRMSDDDEESDDEEDEAEADMDEAEKQKKAMHLSIDITKREDFCICQALSALVLSFSIKIELMQKSDPQYFFAN